MTIGIIKTAAWHGEPINARVVVAIVGDTPKESEEHYQKHYPGKKRYLWYTPFIGTERQVIECKAADYTFYLDNMDGSGLKKVLNGGWPNDGHYSIYPAEIMHEVPAEHWNHYTPELAQIQKDEIDSAWMGIDAEGYTVHKKEMEGILSSLRSFQNMKPDDKVKHIRENMMPANPSKKFIHKGKRDGKGKR